MRYAVLAALMLACGAACASADRPAAAPQATGASPTRQAAATSSLITVKYGQLTPPSVSDSGVLIADSRGWFAEQGIKLDVVAFDSAGNMTSPLGTNQIDAGGGSVGAGLFNAIAHGVPIAIVADKGTTSPGHGYLGLVVRKALVDGGQFKTTADLKGKRVALSATAIAPEVALADLLKTAGLSTSDVTIVPLGFPDMVVALANGSVDAAEPIEPFLTDELDKGVGVLFKRADEYSPGSQNAVLLFSPGFAANPDLATRFMLAYLKGARQYDDAFDRKDANVRNEVIGVLSQTTSLKDAALYEKVAMPGLSPDGTINTDSLQRQQQYYVATGQQQAAVDMAKVVNSTFAESAVAKLGAY